jgi:hypothetical protein
MRDIAAGKAVPVFTPRKRDLMRDFFVSFNALIQAWNSRVGATVDEAGRPAGALANGGATADGPGMNRLQRARR